MTIDGTSIKALENWLRTQGAEFRQPTNQWEVLRFMLGGKLHIVYKRATGRLTYDEQTLRYARMCRDGVAPKIERPRQQAQRQRPVQGQSNGWARNIIRRGHGLKALVLSATTGPQVPQPLT